jgi:hypothetical protein
MSLSNEERNKLNEARPQTVTSKIVLRLEI